MTAISIQNAFERFAPTEKTAEREKRYNDIISQYSPSEQNVFPDMVVTVAEEMELNQDQDFLGEMFMALELGNHWKGQFFTPYSVCQCMAEMMSGDEIKKLVAEKGYVSVNDPACGAGALLIAARNVFARHGVGSDQALFVAQDIDHVAGLMCYIQLSLLGCAGYVVIADSLLYPICGDSPLFPVFNENHDVWYTPAWYTDAWVMRRVLHSADRITAPAGPPAAEAPHIPPSAAKPQHPEPFNVTPTPSPEPPVAVGGAADTVLERT